MFVVVITLMGQLSSANSLKQLLGSVGCNLNQDSQLKNSSEKIEKFVIQKDYLKAWREFNVSFRQSESDKAMSCYYNLKKDELRKLAIEDLRELQKSLKEYEIQRDIGKYELFLEGFKVIFGQFWFYTSPGGPMKEPLTGKFYEKHLAIAQRVKADIKKEEEDRLNAIESARLKKEQEIAQKKYEEERKLLKEKMAKEAVEAAAENAARDAKEKRVKEKANTFGCKRVKAQTEYCKAQIWHRSATRNLEAHDRVTARSGIVDMAKKQKNVNMQIFMEDQMEVGQRQYSEAKGIGAIKCNLIDEKNVPISFSDAFRTKLREESERECGDEDAVDWRFR